MREEPFMEFAYSLPIRGAWKVTDPARVADGYYGVTFHRTKKAAQRRVAAFPGSVMEFVPALSSGGNSK